jgi:hypothetical protein
MNRYEIGQWDEVDAPAGTNGLDGERGGKVGATSS